MVDAGRDVGQEILLRLAVPPQAGCQQVESRPGADPGVVLAVEDLQIAEGRGMMRVRRSAGIPQQATALGEEEAPEIRGSRMGLCCRVTALVELDQSMAGLGVIKDFIDRRVQVIECGLRKGIDRHRRVRYRNRSWPDQAGSR